MELSEMKTLARKNNLKFHKNFGVVQMEKVFKAANIDPNFDPDAIIPDLDKIESQENHDDDTIERPVSYNKSEENEKLARLLKELSSEFKSIDSIHEKKQFDIKVKKNTDAIKELKDEDLILKMLQWQKSRKIINISDRYLLSEIESGLATERCRNVARVDAAGMHLVTGKDYKFSTYFDPTRECDIYNVYVDRTIEGEAQIDKGLAFKMRNGFMPEISDFKEDKIVWYVFPLAEKEFLRYFEVLEEY